MRRRTLGIVVTVMLFTLTLSAQASDPEVNLVPWPQSLTVAGGHMALTASSRVVYSDKSLLPLAQILAEEIEAVTRLDVAVTSGSPSAGDICLRLTTDPAITGEAYRVTVADYATVEAANYNAVATGSVTLLQAIKKSGSVHSMPSMLVTDQPDAVYRGHMVDAARDDCRSGNDVAHFWVNPSLDQEPDLHVANGTYTGGDIGLGNSVGFSIQGYGRGIYIYDEIRVGSTWAHMIGGN